MFLIDFKLFIKLICKIVRILILETILQDKLTSTAFLEGIKHSNLTESCKQYGSYKLVNIVILQDKPSSV